MLKAVKDVMLNFALLTIAILNATTLDIDISNLAVVIVLSC